MAQRPTEDQARLAVDVEVDSDVRGFVNFELLLTEVKGFAYMFELGFCCILGRSPSDCAPSAPPLVNGICGIGKVGPLLAPLKRLLGGVGVALGRSKGGAVFGAVSGRESS